MRKSIIVYAVLFFAFQSSNTLASSINCSGVESHLDYHYGQADVLAEMIKNLIASGDSATAVEWGSIYEEQLRRMESWAILYGAYCKK